MGGERVADSGIHGPAFGRTRDSNHFLARIADNVRVNVTEIFFFLGSRGGCCLLLHGLTLIPLALAEDHDGGNGRQKAGEHYFSGNRNSVHDRSRI